jgi:hypothetical protein
VRQDDVWKEGGTKKLSGSLTGAIPVTGARAGGLLTKLLPEILMEPTTATEPAVIEAPPDTAIALPPVASTTIPQLLAFSAAELEDKMMPDPPGGLGLNV